MHILDASGGEYRIAVHVAIPAGNNTAGVSWQTALLNSGLGGKSILISGDGTNGTISATEKTAIETTGSVYEVIVSVDPTQRGQNATLGQLANFLDDWYAALSVVELTQLQARLKWFGQTR